MKKLISSLLALMLALSSLSAFAANKVYDYSGDIPEGDSANFYAYTIAQNATRYSPWFVQWARQSQAEYDLGRRGGDGNQVVTAIGVSPVNPDHMLLGSDMAGIWRSTDGGINWETIGGNNNTWCCSEIVWSPTDEQVVFAVQTCMRDYSTNAINKAKSTTLDGLYKSTDAGKTWRQVLSENFISGACSFGLVRYDKEGGIYALSSNGLYYSTDDGETWELVDKFMEDNSGVYSLYLFEDGKRMLAAGTGGLYYTSSRGLLWNKKSDSVEGVKSCTSVTVDPYDEKHWFACFQGPEKKLYESKDGGETWEKVYYRMNSSGLATPRLIQYIVKPDGKTRLFLGYNNCGNPLQYTDDCGKTWNVPELRDRSTIYNNTSKGYMSEGFAIIPTRPGHIYYSFADYVYLSTDSGENFYPRNNGYSGINTRNIVFDKEGKLWFCDVDRGLAVTTKPYKKGEYSPVERVIKNKGEAKQLAIDPNNSSHMYCSNDNNVLETDDGGKTWHDVPGAGKGSEVLQYHANDPSVIYAGYATSFDGGRNWIPNEYTISAVSPKNNDVLYSLKSNTMYRSKDRGKTWEKCASTNSVYVVMADSFDENTVWYAGYNGVVYKCAGTSVSSFREANGIKTDAGELVSITAIAQDPKNANHLIVGGKDTKGGLKTPGVYETYDGGNSWILVPGMKGIADITSITFSPVSDEVFIGTCSNGFIIYDYPTFKKWYEGNLEWDKSDEIIIPNMYKDGRIRVKIDSDVIGFDSDPFISNGRTFVPMRKIFEVFGAKIEWNGDTQTVTATRGSDVISLTIGKNVATVNGVEKPLDEAPCIANSRTMIPLRFVAEALGCKVDWDGSNQLVVIKSK